MAGSGVGSNSEEAGTWLSEIGGWLERLCGVGGGSNDEVDADGSVGCGRVGDFGAKASIAGSVEGSVEAGAAGSSASSNISAFLPV